jgi:putative aldouronate transport system permease protein
MILPSVILIILFSYFPLYGIIIAFKNFDIFEGILKSPLAREFGFEHFIDMFADPYFLLVIRNTVVISLLKLLFLSIPPVALAIMMNEIAAKRFKKITQTISYLPHFVSWIIIGGMMLTFLAPVDDSPLNKVLLGLHLIDQPIDIVNNNVLYWPLLIISDLWKEVGWGTIIYLAVIATIDREQYEAIEIDGGGRWAKIMHVTLPALKGTFIILFILACGGIMRGLGDAFEQSYVLGSALNKNVSYILDLYVLRIGLENARYSFAAAAGLFQAVVNLLLLIGVNSLARRVTGKGLF